MNIDVVCGVCLFSSLLGLVLLWFLGSLSGMRVSEGHELEKGYRIGKLGTELGILWWID